MIIFIRYAPPLDSVYLYTTQLLELRSSQSVLLLNNPQSLRDCNERPFATQCSAWTPETIVAATRGILLEFLEKRMKRLG